VAKAEAALAQLELPAAQIERTVTDASGYWVHMPPQKTKTEADRKVRELNTLGVTELVMVTDPGEWRYAISLGIFRTDEAAQAFLAGLRKQGVRSAVVARRENFLKQVVFYVREPSPATTARLTLTQAEFPGSELKAGPCPKPAASG
jgi:cell division protein FtsN